ncbi:MAG TPA: PilC/PilY family type IV pilus protein, partial [Casimicrobiaceae bacterium]|nr:PilC/PilY family type IV pilus protein [Casimicrobiaceae bacterium]
FCDNVDTTVNGPWRGFGTGVCKPSNDLTRYQNVQYGQFHRVALVAGRTYDYTDQTTSLPSTRTFAQETANYANWYAYYRLRILAAKTTSTLAFNLLDDTYRVGFHTLGEEPPPIGPTPTSQPPAWVDVADFKSGAGNQKNLWWNALFAVPTVTKVKTPSLSALLRVGNLFETGGASGLPASVYPLPAGAKDPLKDASGNVVSCQSNYHIEMTDGFTNQIALPVFAGERDDVTPAAWPAAGLLPDGSANPDNTMPDLPPSSPWPPPFRWGTKAVPDTLADIAMYYWARDLRPGVKDDVPSWSGKTPNDVDPTKDVAWWQHVQFSAISFGSAGTLDVDNQGATLAAMQPPPTGVNLQWPDLTNPNMPQLPIGNKGAVAIDDLWHATVNARGQYVFATSPLEVQYGLGAILAGISNQRKSRAGAAFSGQVLSSTNDIIYEPTIEQGWAGDLLKVQIDANPKSPTAGQEIATLWRASPVLWDRTLNTGQIAPKFVGDEPWMDETKRRIVSWFGNKKVAFRATAAGALPALDASQLATLSGNGFMQRRMVAYLRGGTTYTTTAADPAPAGTVMTIEGTGIGQFRKRSGPLGDISNAQPLVVSAPYDPPIFNTGADPGYAGFVAAQKAAGYKDRIVAAANDGMVHVFDSTDGHEVFAYVPSSLFRNSVDASGRPTGIQALTFQDGGVPLYHHHFYVDASPRTADVDCDNAGACGGGSSWRTIVVGGMGKGGDAYYALDLTDGDATDETQAAAKLLWEFHDSDWKYTYGRPIIVKTYQYGWTVIVTSGYNNASGEGRIYLLNPTTGKPQNPAQPYIATPKVTCTAPDGSTETSGLAQINGFTKDFHNQFVEQVYGGDLCGNVWRFDLTATSGGYPPPQLFAVLTDPGGNVQPITTAPQIEIDLANGVDRYVFIGTGRLLDVSDLSIPTTPQPQTMYAIRDGKLETPIPDGDPTLPIAPRATMAAVPAGGAAVPGGAPNGWYHDLPDGTGGTIAERVVVDVEADVNTVAYIGTQVTNDPCTIALPANIYAREFATATSLINDPLTGWFTHDNAGGVGMQIVGYQDPSTGEITLAGLLSHEIPGTKPISFKNPSTFGRNRMSWRLLTGE